MDGVHDVLDDDDPVVVVTQTGTVLLTLGANAALRFRTVEHYELWTAAVRTSAAQAVRSHRERSLTSLPWAVGS